MLDYVLGFFAGLLPAFVVGIVFACKSSIDNAVWD